MYQKTIFFFSYRCYSLDATGSPSRFRNNFFKRIQKTIVKTDDKIKDEKLQIEIIREAAKISALSSKKVDKYEYLTGEEILQPDQRRAIE